MDSRFSPGFERRIMKEKFRIVREQIKSGKLPYQRFHLEETPEEQATSMVFGLEPTQEQIDRYNKERETS